MKARGAGLLSVVLAVAAACLPGVAQAQYFGRNQVQYQSFDFRILRTDHFDVYFYPSEAASAPMAARIAERWYARLSKIMGDSLHGRQPLIIYASQAQFQQTNAVGGDIGEGTGGVTESFKRRIVLPFGATLEETDHVIGHELVHAFQYDITSGGRLQAPGAVNLPLWFIEGMAEYLSIGPVDPGTTMWMRDAVQQNHVPKFKNLDDPRYFPYRWGQALWAYVGGRWGDEVIGQVLRSASRTRDPMLALRNVLGIEPDSLEAQWRTALRTSYQPLIDARTTADSVGTKLFGKLGQGGDYNVGPALSPDGNDVVFLSSRGLFSIDMYLADATTGRVRRRLTSTAFDPHVESLMFIYSAGSWAPDGRDFVYAATVDGRPALEVEDAFSGHTIREIKLHDLDEIYSPSFSPDGRKIVFSAHQAGVTDLYVYDLDANQRTQLTNDAYADMQPVYSPDGRSIAFVTDRFTTDLSHLQPGDLRLALLDVASGHISEVPGFRQGKHINPQWSQDGKSLYFLADPDGVANVYRLALGDSAGARLYRVTNVATGAAGITENSPALSLAAHADRAVISLFRDRTYEVHRLEAQDLVGTPVGDSAVSRVAETLPPRTTTPAPSQVLSYRADAVTGLPPEDSFPVTRYAPTFGLDYVAQPYLSAGVSSFGTYVGGGVQMFWSSMLGERQMATLFQINGGIRDIAAEVDYINLAHRVDWGVSASQIPYLTAQFGEGYDQTNNQIVDQELLYRQTSRQIQGMIQYPFNRVQRLEFSAGALMLSYDIELREQRFDANTGAQVSNTDSLLPGCAAGQSLSNTLCAPSPIYLGQGTAALVYDNSLSGGTGPILGTRYRFEADPSFGSINFVGALADFRKYVMPVRPLTIAFRAMHFGRYGSGAADQRLFPLYIGYQTLVRGYDFNSIAGNECSNATSLSNCPLSNRLFGSRIVVGNIEGRLPILGAPFGLLIKGAAPPVDLVVFGDYGAVYNFPGQLSGSAPTGPGDWRRAVSSYGSGLRINLFGFLIGEVDYVYPVARPQKGWFFQLGFSPGF